MTKFLLDNNSAREIDGELLSRAESQFDHVFSPLVPYELLKRANKEDYRRVRAAILKLKNAVILPDPIFRLKSEAGFPIVDDRDESDRQFATVLFHILPELETFKQFDRACFTIGDEHPKSIGGAQAMACENIRQKSTEYLSYLEKIASNLSKDIKSYSKPEQCISAAIALARGVPEAAGTLASDQEMSPHMLDLFLPNAFMSFYRAYRFVIYRKKLDKNDWADDLIFSHFKLTDDAIIVSSDKASVEAMKSGLHDCSYMNLDLQGEIRLRVVTLSEFKDMLDKVK